MIKCECGNTFSYYSKSGFITCLKCKKRLKVPISKDVEKNEEMEEETEE